MPKKSPDWLSKMRHTAAHILAHAVLNLYGDKVKFGIGPVIESGFYYDFDFSAVSGGADARGLDADRRGISEKDLPRIEREMKRLIKQNLKMQEIKLKPAEIKKLFKNQPYKLELQKELGRNATFYQIGDFLDLCRGGHVSSSRQIPADGLKLTHIAGAYWRGSEQNPMLTRIYAAAFDSQKELDEFLAMQEEAKKRDHRKLGPVLELFMFHETSPGMPYWLPKGVAIYNELVNIWREEHKQNGYQEIFSPLLNKKELYVTSGHYEHYWDSMFVAKTPEKEEYGVKAMNCPNAMVVFGSKLRSYKDLPFRLGDTDTLHRYEPSGTLSGLFRVREFRQDDAHIFVTEEQIGKEYDEIFQIVDRFYSIFNLEYSFRLGTLPEKFLGDEKTWDKAEEALKQILKKSGKKFTVLEGDGAFYGPKVDILMKDVLGREWQMGTIQLDFQQPRRFGLEYIDSHGQKKTPVVIHRVVYGSLERFIGILIEHFAGAFPVWLAPVQIAILSISDELNEYALSVAENLRIKNQELRITIDDRNETISKKIREAEKQKIPYMLIVGKKEVKEQAVSVRQRGERDLGVMKVERFAERIRKEIEDKK